MITMMMTIMVVIRMAMMMQVSDIPSFPVHYAEYVAFGSV